MRYLPYAILPATLLSTSLGAYLLARRAFALEPRHLRAGVAAMLECVGLTAAFFAVNLLVGVAVVFVLRQLPILFVTLYATTDLVLVLLSLVQGLIFHGWRATASAAAER